MGIGSANGEDARMNQDPRSPTPSPQRGRGAVLAHGLAGRDPLVDHEAATLVEVSKRLAALLGYEFAGTAPADLVREAVGPDGALYLVPPETIIGLDTAAALGIQGERDLFGGVVPHPFVATKSITHPVVSPQAKVPDGWSADFGQRVGDSVLAGFAAFDRDDALDAAGRLITLGPVRIKRVRATGGHGQTVIQSLTELADVLADVDDGELATWGLVLEQDLESVTTYSVGITRVGGAEIAYFGTQRLTPDNHGEDVYGGSDLVVVRGGIERLLALELSDDVRDAIDGARAYDEAVDRCFPGFIASRRNYDTVVGRDRAGRARRGVLEQSWRIGGASGAEIAALEAFAQEPTLAVVRASTVEVFGDPDSTQVPPQATVYFRGTDARAGPLTKYATGEPYE
jgi:hypothetical protein